MKSVFLLFVLFLTTSFSPTDVCPICHSLLSKSITSKTTNGVRYYKYTCKNNHEVWKESSLSKFGRTEKTSKEKKSKSSECSCPVCGFHGYITSTIGVKKCIHGHTFKCN